MVILNLNLEHKFQLNIYKYKLQMKMMIKHPTKKASFEDRNNYEEYEILKL
jgi:hypothetical protein